MARVVEMKAVAAAVVGRARGIAGVSIALLAAALLAAEASADLYRCVKADGGIVFTDNAATCPARQKHEPRGLLQTVSGGDTPPPAAPDPPISRPAEAAVDDAAVQKEQWQQKKRTTEDELKRLEERNAKLAEFVTACNRGLAIISRDDHTGLKHQVPCERIREEYSETESESKRLRDYLDSGLQQECREAGCLPGWIR